MKWRRLITVLTLFSPCVAAAQATQPASDELERLREIKQIVDEVARLPKIKADSIDQVIQFSVEENMLAVRTALVPEEGPALVTGTSLPGAVRLSVIGPRDQPELLGRNFTFLQRDYTDATKGTVYTDISAIAGRVNLARMYEAGGTNVNIQFVQDPPPPIGEVPDADPVRLMVDVNSESVADKSLKVKVSAATFVELCRKHRREVDTYLRPIVRDFGQEAGLFGVRPEIAWQVLGDSFVPDAKLVEQINQIIARFNAEDFRKREDAATQLKAIGQPATFVLAKLDRTKLSLQQNNSIDAFLAEFAPLAPDQARALADDRGFLLDVLYIDDANLRRLATEQLSKITGRKVESDGIFNSETIAKLRDELIPTTHPVKERP